MSFLYIHIVISTSLEAITLLYDKEGMKVTHLSENTLELLLSFSFHIQFLHIAATVITVCKIALYAIIKNDIELTI